MDGKAFISGRTRTQLSSLFNTHLTYPDNRLSQEQDYWENMFQWHLIVYLDALAPPLSKRILRIAKIENREEDFDGNYRHLTIMKFTQRNQTSNARYTNTGRINTSFVPRATFSRTLYSKYMQLRTNYWNYIDNINPGSNIKFEDYTRQNIISDEAQTVEHILSNVDAIESTFPRTGIIIYCVVRKAFLMVQQIVSRRWTNVGGKVEDTSNIFKEAQREAMEEANIDIKFSDVTGRFKHQACTWYVVARDMRRFDPIASGAVEKARSGKEIVNIAWISEAELSGHMCSGTSIAAIKLARQHGLIPPY